MTPCCHGDRRIIARGVPAWGLGRVAALIGAAQGYVRRVAAEMAISQREWSREEISNLEFLWPRMAVYEIAGLLGRTLEEVMSKAAYLGLNAECAERDSDRWLEWEDASLRGMVGRSVPYARIASTLGRSVEAIKSRATDLGLSERASPE